MPSAARGEVAGSRLGNRPGLDPLAIDPSVPECGETLVLDAPVFDRERIAGLSSSDIHDLTCDELVGVVRSAGLPFLPSDVQGRLEFQDRCVLERLAFLARQCCRTRRRPGTPELYENPELFE